MQWACIVGWIIVDYMDGLLWMDYGYRGITDQLFVMG